MKILIVDHDPCERSTLAQLCQNSLDLEVVGEAESGGAAIDAAANLLPDVMLIDVSLPDMSGFEVLRLATNAHGPLSIMTSERSDRVEQAMARGAVDYLLKPVRVDRLALAIERVRQRFTLGGPAHDEVASQILRLLGRRPKLLVGERQRRLYPLDIEKIDYIEADGNYVTIRAANNEYLSRDSIKRLASELADFGFVRIDRSILLNIRAVEFAEPVGHGTLTFTLSCGACLHSSRKYRDAILRVLPWHHSRAAMGLE